MSKLKVLLIDDHEIVRAGFKSLLTTSGGYEVVEAGSAEMGYKLYRKQRPDVVVSDINMPGIGGIELARRVMAFDPKAKIIVLSMYDDISYVDNMKKLGVKGYVTKRSAPTELLAAIKRVSLCQFYLSEDLKKKSKSLLDGADQINELTNREFEIFVLLAQGRTVTDVSNDLCISNKTASNHRDKIMSKLGIRNLVELTRYAIRHSIVPA